MSAFQDSIAGGLASIRNAAGTAIVVRSGARSCAIEAAGIAQSEFESASEDGLVVSTFRTRDYLVAVDELQFDGAAVLPHPGFTIEETTNGQTRRYEVLAPAGRPCFEYTDRGETQYRIHTKRIA